MDERTGVSDLVMDPSNPEVLYAATWQRHRTVAAYLGGGPGTGLHRSTDGGESWEHMGLRNSEHISRIIIDPDNSNRVYVAAYGPLWSEGDDRGIYKSEDGGATWSRVLYVSEHTGFSDLRDVPVRVLGHHDPVIQYRSVQALAPCYSSCSIQNG